MPSLHRTAALAFAICGFTFAQTDASAGNNPYATTVITVPLAFADSSIFVAPNATSGSVPSGCYQRMTGDAQILLVGNSFALLTSAQLKFDLDPSPNCDRTAKVRHAELNYAPATASTLLPPIPGTPFGIDAIFNPAGVLTLSGLQPELIPADPNYSSFEYSGPPPAGSLATVNLTFIFTAPDLNPAAPQSLYIVSAYAPVTPKLSN